MALTYEFPKIRMDVDERFRRVSTSPLEGIANLNAPYFTPILFIFNVCSAEVLHGVRKCMESLDVTDEGHARICRGYVCVQFPRSPANPKGAPDFGLIGSVNHYRIMCRR